MGAKQPRGLAGAGLPPTMIFGPREWHVGARSRAGSEAVGDAPLPMHADSLGAGAHGAGGPGALHPFPPMTSHRRSKTRRLLAGSPPQRRCETAAVPPAAPSCPTTVTAASPEDAGPWAWQRQRIGKERGGRGDLWGCLAA